MHLDWLQIKRVRNLSDVHIEAIPQINLITGENASGKTAILESIYLLARARSFRTPRIQEVIKKGDKALQVTACIIDSLAGRTTLGIEKGRGQMTLRNNGTTVKTVSEQAKNLPLVLITPDTHLLVTGTPKQRRHWLDWAMFHVEQRYLEDWRSYFKALRHRNALLKAGKMSNTLYESWEKTMVETGVRLQKARESFIQKVQKTANPLLNKVFPGFFEIKYNLGVSGDEEQFSAYLMNERAKDRVYGFTGQGPHRTDLDFIYENERVAATFSRGQLKLFISVLVLSEAKVLASLIGESPIILIDDYSAELDIKASEYLLSILNEGPFQVFLTTIGEPRQSSVFDSAAVFHVEHGEVQKVVK